MLLLIIFRLCGRGNVACSICCSQSFQYAIVAQRASLCGTILLFCTFFLSFCRALHVLCSHFFVVFLSPFPFADCRIHEKSTRNTVERIQGIGDRGDVSLVEFGTSKFHHYIGGGNVFLILLRYHHRPSCKSWPSTRYLHARSHTLASFFIIFFFFFSC